MRVSGVCELGLFVVVDVHVVVGRGKGKGTGEEGGVDLPPLLKKAFVKRGFFAGFEGVRYLE